MSNYLLDEEGVAEGGIVKGIGINIDAACHPFNAGFRESGQLDANCGGTKVGDHQPQARIEIELLGSVGDDETAIGGLDPPPQVTDQAQRRFIRPVHVLKDHDNPVVLEEIEHS